MKLYEKCKDKICVYNFEENIKKLKEYRNEIIMKQYYNNELFYKINSYCKNDISKIFNTNSFEYISCGNEYFDEDICIIPDKETKLKKGLYSEKQLIHDALLEKYINGELSDLKITRFYSSLNINKYYNFLKPTGFKIKNDTYNNSKLYYVENLMNLPLSLANINFLQSGEFENLYLDNIEEQLALFYLKKIEKISINNSQNCEKNLNSKVNYILLNKVKTLKID